MIDGFVVRFLVAFTLMVSPTLAQETSPTDCEEAATLLESVMKIRDEGATEHEADSAIVAGGWSAETADLFVVYAYLLFQDFTPREGYHWFMSTCFSD